MRKSSVVLSSFVLALGCSKSSAPSTASDQPAAATAASSVATSVATPTPLPVIAAVNGKAFEGEIALDIVETSRAKQESILLQMKGQKIRFAMSPGGRHDGSGIFDLANKKMITIIDPKKMYMEMDLGSIAARRMGTGGSPTAGTSDSTPPKITKTGKHETVAGHDCEDWEVTDARGKKVLLCMSSDIGAFDFSGIEGASFIPPSLKASIFGSGFPIKMVEFDDAGKEKTRVEATRIERKTEDDANFVPPPGYTKLDLANLGGLGAAMGAGGRPPGM